MSDWTEKDLDRALGIGEPVRESDGWSEFDRQLSEVKGGHGDRWDEFDAELERLKPGQSRAEGLLDKALGIDATEAEASEAQRMLGEAESHPWRVEWPKGERLSRKGEEAQLAEMFTSRLGESKSVAEAHVHRVLSAAWTQSWGVKGRLEAVSETLAGERRRMEAKTPLWESRRPSSTAGKSKPSKVSTPPKTRRIAVSETTRQQQAEQEAEAERNYAAKINRSSNINNGK